MQEVFGAEVGVLSDRTTFSHEYSISILKSKKYANAKD